MKVKVVHGLPLTGKSTYVAKNINKNSIVYDYDRLETALTYKKEHKREKGNAHMYIIAIRNTIIKMMKNEDKLDTVWIVTTKLTDYLKEELKDFDVDYIHLEASKEELIERLENDENRTDKEEWKKAIEELYESESEKRMAISNDREYRSFIFDKKEGDMIVEGIPIVFDTPTLMYENDGIKYYEVIERGAFDGAMIDDVVLNVDHTGKPAAKTRNNTLKLTLNDRNMEMWADLSKNATGRELFEDIQNGFYDKMSFAFTVSDETYERETRTRVIKKIERLYDVSAVTIPAYNQTRLQARSFFDTEVEKERLEKRNREFEIEKLKLRLRLERGA